MKHFTPISDDAIIDYSTVDSNPSETFDKFSYNMLDESMDDLKNDLIELDMSANKQVADYRSSNSSSELALKEIYQKFSNLYGYQVGYTNFKDFVQDIAKNNRAQKVILEAVNAKIATQISQRTGAKLMLTINTLIDRTTDAILKISEGLLEPDPIVVGMLDKCFQWQQQLLEMEEHYNLKISDPDKTIKTAIDKEKGIEEINSKNDGQDIVDIEAILNSLHS